MTPPRLAMALPLLLLGSGSALGQVLDSYFTPVPRVEADTGTTNRSQADALNAYQSSGVRLGTFLLHPELTEEEGYNSNVEGISDGRGSPTVRTSGLVTATSDWSRDSLLLQAAVDDHRFLTLPQQNYTDWHATIAGSVDVEHDAITASYTHVDVAQLPGSLNAVTFVQPVPLHVDSVRLGYAATERGRFTIIPELRVANYASDDFVVNNVSISQAYRDRIAVQPDVTARYQLASQRDLVFVVQGTHLKYRTGFQGLPKRDSDGIALLGGIDYSTPGANLRVRALVGVQTRQYHSSVYESQTAPILELAATWTPTRLTTVTFTARRDIDDAADESIASYILTAARLNLDHELRRNILLRSYVDVQQAEYGSSKAATLVTTINAAGTTQLLYTVDTGATWLLNRNARLNFDYGFTARQGGHATSNYNSSITVLSLTLSL